MALIKARCTNCNGDIMTDNRRDAAICPLCMEPYVVEKAIRRFQYPDPEENARREESLQGTDQRETTGRERAGRSPLEESEGRAGMTAAEALLVEKIMRAVMENAQGTVNGLFRALPDEDGSSAAGTFEPEDAVKKSLQGLLDVSFLSPSLQGSGMAELLREYSNNYGGYDVFRGEFNEEVIVSNLRTLLQENGIHVSDICVRPLSMSRCEWYEVKEFFGMKTRREKKLVSKNIRALYLSCDRF